MSVPEAVGVCSGGPHPFREVHGALCWALTAGLLGSLQEVGPPAGVGVRVSRSVLSVGRLLV